MVISKSLRYLSERPRAWIEKRRLFNFYGSLISNGSLVFDVGANVGDKTAIFRQLNARVISIEPQKDCLEKLRARFAKDQGVTIFPGAMGAKLGKKSLYVRSRYNGFSSLNQKWMAGTKYGQVDNKEIVRIYTLDYLIKKYGLPSFCKIDVEGYELEVLKGLRTKIPCLSFEINSNHFNRAIRCLDRLQKLGYKLFNYTGPEAGPKLRNWVSRKTLVEIISAAIKSGYPGGDIYAK